MAGQLDISLEWLNCPSFDDGLQTAQERFDAVVKHHFEAGMPREIDRIVNDVCRRHGVVDDEPIAPEIQQSILSEVSERVAHLIVGIPYEKALAPDELAKLLEGASSGT